MAAVHASMTWNEKKNHTKPVPTYSVS